jgi:hypothetical protein
MNVELLAVLHVIEHLRDAHEPVTRMFLEEITTVVRSLGCDVFPDAACNPYDPV